MLCMECLHAHIPSPSSTPSHMPMPSVTTVTGSTNDTHIPSPYRLTNTQCKCQWATNLESIPTPVTQLEVYVITMTVCLLLATELFGLRRGSLTPIHNFSDHTGSLTHMFQAFHLRGLTIPFLLRPIHIIYISFYVLNRETFIGRHPKYELTTHPSTLMMDDHTHAHTSMSCDDRVYEMQSCHFMLCHATCNIYKLKIIIFPTYNFHSSQFPC